jgi:hypothetical protein
MLVVGRLVGTFEPALVTVTMAQANSASAEDKHHRAEPACRHAGRQERQGHEPVEREGGNDGKPPCQRRPNNDLSGICRVIHGGTSERRVEGCTGDR